LSFGEEGISIFRWIRAFMALDNLKLTEVQDLIGGGKGSLLNKFER